MSEHEFKGTTITDLIKRARNSHICYIKQFYEKFHFCT